MKVSLLAPESTGGAIAREGFGYQDAYVLQNLPVWLTQSAFSHVVSEAAGDIEVCYFGPTDGTVRVFYEAKGKQLTESEFWAEIVQFKKAYDTSPSEFVHFVLICQSYNSVTAFRQRAGSSSTRTTTGTAFAPMTTPSRRNRSSRLANQRPPAATRRAWCLSSSP